MALVLGPLQDPKIEAASRRERDEGATVFSGQFALVSCEKSPCRSRTRTEVYSQVRSLVPPPASSA